MKKLTEKDLTVTMDKTKGWNVSAIIDNYKVVIIYFDATRRQAIKYFLEEFKKGL